MDANKCEVHGWWMDEGEQCPVCEGREMREAEIIALLEDVRDGWMTEDLGGALYPREATVLRIVALIKGENNV